MSEDLRQHLLANPCIHRGLIARIAETMPDATLHDFDTDLALASTGARNPFFFVLARWRDGQRLHPSESSAASDGIVA